MTLVLCLITTEAWPAYECGGQVDNCPCGRATPCICCECGNCVWWGWHEACCHWGRALPWCTDAGTWDNYAASYGYPTDGSAQNSSVFVCGPGGYCSSYGHVGWVYAVYPDGSFDSSEQACGGWCGVANRHHFAGYAHTFICNPATGCGTPCECTPGQVESRSCCDCGTQSRQCGGDCRWGGWGGCNGPDPDGGNRACSTGEPGVCAEGRMRCQSGCLRCVRLEAPSTELCDRLDNDCDGLVNEEHPDAMGDPPPDYAGRLKDSSYPRVMAAGEQAWVWAEFQNVGARPWAKGEVMLAALASQGGEASRFFSEGSWSSWDVAATLDRDVAPGASGRFAFKIKASPAAGREIDEMFGLMDAAGSLIECPVAEVRLAVTVTPGTGAPGDGGSGADGYGVGSDMPLSGGCGCSIVGWD